MNKEIDSNVSGAISSSIVIRMPLLSIHPYNNFNCFIKHQPKFKDMIPKTDIRDYVHECGKYTTKLNLIQHEDVFLQVYHLENNSDFIRRLERFILEGKFTNSTKYVEKYLIILATKELYLKTTKNYLSWFPEYYKEFLSMERYTPPFQFIFGQLYACQEVNPFVRPMCFTLPNDFKCSCYTVWSSHQEGPIDYSSDEYDLKEEVEPTALVNFLNNFAKSIGAACATNYYAYKAMNYDITQVKNDFLADLVLLIADFNIKTLIWAFVKLINKFFNEPNLFSIILNLYQYCSNLFTSSPTQQNLGEFEPTNDSFQQLPQVINESIFSDFFSQIKISIPAVCSIMATILVVLVALFMGKDVLNDKSMLTKSKVKRVCEAFYQVSRAGSSIKNLSNILTIWPKWVHDMSFEFLLGHNHTKLEELLFSSDVKDPPDFNRRDFFKDIDFLTNPVNTITIGRNDQLRAKLLWCDNLLNDMAKTLAQEPTSEINRITTQWIFTKIQHTRIALTSIARQPSPHHTRFVPFWINLIGSSGLGKTTLIPHILNTVKEVLKTCKDHENEPIPNNQEWMYSMNFCAKHMTGYNGQYCVVIDDLFQDAQIVGDATPSALLLIQMVSSQPFPTIQASVDDKGIEFTSKIIMSSSNDYHIHRKEIVDSTALLRRMNVRVHLREEDSSIPFDSGLKDIGHHKNISFNVYNHDGTTLLHKFNYNNLCAYIAASYIQWYKLQKKLMASVTSMPKNVDTIIKALESGSDLDNLPLDSHQSHRLGQIRKLRLPVLKMKESQETQPKASTSHESTQSWNCYLLGKGRIVNKLINVIDDHEGFIQIPVEQYDCDCIKCISLNNYYRQHRHAFYRSFADIPTISEFLTLTQSPPDQITQQHQNRFTSIWETIKKILKESITHPLFIILSSVAVVASMIYAAKNLVQEPTRLMYSSGSVPKKLQPKIMVKPLKPIRFEPTHAYTDVETELRVAIPNQNTYDLIYKLLRRNTLCILRKIQDNKVMTNSAVRIVGTCILTNHHFFKYLNDGDEFEVIVHNCYEGLSIKKQIFNKRRYIQLQDIDAGIYKCDNKIPHSTSIISHFLDKDIPDMKHNSIMLSIYDPEQLSSPVVIPGIVAQPCKTISNYEENFSTLDTFTTNMNVTRGQSGSILISTEPSSQNKIIGILVCRSRITTKGYFKPVSKFSLQSAIELLEVDENLSLDIDQDVEVTGATAIQSFNKDFESKSLNYVGKIPLSKQVTQAISTNFTPSLISDGITDFSPAVLHPQDDRLDPALKGKPIIFRSIQGFNEQIGAIDTKELDIVVEEMSSDYLNMKEPPTFERKLLNDYQMINGVKPYLKKLDMRTSPGYPFVKQKDSTDLGKYRWFNEINPLDESDGKVFEMKDELKKIVSSREERAKEGFKTSTIAYMCLKDELRPNAKIEKGETRVFTCLPMDYNLLIRKYFGAFIIIQHHNAGQIPSCVGVNPAKDWYEIWMRLNSKDTLWEDFDYKNWDQHLHPELVMRVADVVSKWYGDDYKSKAAKVRRVLLHDLIHTTIMVKDCLFIKSCGQCSGCAITAELNCVVHDLLMYYVYRLHCKRSNILCDITKYRSEVESALYGDDIIKSVIKGSTFLGQNIKPFMDQLGMSITPGDKLTTEFKLKKPEDLLFLKRSFTIDTEISKNLESSSVRAPLRKDIVLNIYKWIRKTGDPITSTKENCDTALREMFMYGRKEFNEQKQLINKLIQNYNNNNVIKIDYITLSYDNLLLEYESGNFNLVGFEPNH
uniref:Nonstructural polyprotein n=1 Tax=Robinvale bee virus 6 TaxID=2201317 RepID=A0A2U8JQA1_9VIRU|nr:nonstructural polyprotein [Robinvale bee virus 6]